MRLLLLIMAALALLPVFSDPFVRVAQPVRNYLFVVDITQSMNVRDYIVEGRPIDRLNFVKAALIRALPGLPCGSSVGLGLFTAWQTAVLFHPIEVCHHRREIDTAIRNIDWRMAWAPMSKVARAIDDALSQLSVAGQDDAALVFFTDGEEAPSVDVEQLATTRKAASRRPRGVLVGVGDLRPSAIPQFNQGGNMVGYIQQGGQPMLSGLQEIYLRKLGRGAGLDYHRLRTSERLVNLLRSQRYADPHRARLDISWLFGAVALALLTAVYVVAPLTSEARRG
ncbi:MAG: vWA domain-containing protein [Gammaproteobacteria bacterium]